jgi:hypothetical protein
MCVLFKKKNTSVIKKASKVYLTSEVLYKIKINCTIFVQWQVQIKSYPKRSIELVRNELAM